VADEDWRVEVELDDEKHGYSLAEHVAALDLDDEARKRLGDRVVVSRDRSRVFLYAADEAQAREAERVVRDLVAEEALSAEISTSRWHPIEEAWRDASSPLPTAPDAVEEELARRETAEAQKAERTRSWNWHLRAELPHRREAVELAASLEAEGLRVHRRWRYVTVDLATEEAATELGDRLIDALPDGAGVTVKTKPPDPIFVLMSR
jgi:hypothetical protein